jgi:hypothetical protein
VKRLKDLELENSRLRKAVSGLALDKLIVQESSLPGNTAAMAIARSPNCCARRAG